jgi:glycosyltransferase involved in cell wall biosynthesis
VQFHLLSFEGPDGYARVGGLATRVEGLSRTLVGLGHEVHLWFVGDPDGPAEEDWEGVHLHRWCQWMSRHHPGGVYEGDYAKQVEYAASLPPFLMKSFLLPRLRAGRRAVVLAEEWQTSHAVLHLHWLLRYERARERIRILWNANNTFGFEFVPWLRLCQVATVTTVSRYMKQRMHEIGVEAVVIPNGLPADTFATPDPPAVGALRRRMRQRTTVAKLARWDPDKRWLDAVETVGEMKRQGWRPLLLARGGSEPYGAEVIAAAESQGLRVIERSSERGGKAGLLEVLARVGDADVVVLRSHLDPEARRVLLRAADAVLANSRHEPFGLVGLETMASGGVACTGNTGEDYVVSGQNALVLETGEPREFMTLFAPLRDSPGKARALRRAGMATARRFAWPEVVERVLFPRVQLARDPIWEGSSKRGSGLRSFGAKPRRGVPAAHRGPSEATRSPGSYDGASSGSVPPESPGD